jgi:hypothetical protein
VICKAFHFKVLAGRAVTYFTGALGTHRASMAHSSREYLRSVCWACRISFLRSILQDATENPSFLVYFYKRFALPVFACLGHFSPWVCPKSCCHCKRGIITYLVIRRSTSSTGKLRKGKHVLHLSSGGNSLLLAIVYPSDLRLTTPSPPNIQYHSFFCHIPRGLVSQCQQHLPFG